MANGNIRGITIEIGGDTKGLTSALKDVNKQSKDLQGELKAVERGLKFDPGNVELVRQKQELLTASITATSEKLDVLKTAQSQVEAQFQRGDIGIEQYRAFQRELQSTENEMKRLRSQYDSLNIDQERLAQVTRELGTFFDATNTDVEQFAGTLGTRLTQAIRDGSASADQMERALRLMGQQALGTSTDIDKMRETLRSVDNGSSLDEIRVDFKRVSESANEAEKSVKGFGDELSTVVGGLAAGGGIAGVVSSALDASSLRTKIDISFNVPEESKQSVIDAVRTIEAYGIEGEEALEGIRRQWALNKDASDESNTSIVEGAAVIAKAYAGIDFIELIQETNEIASELKISNEEALGLTNSLLKLGFPPEQLDIISEYGNQLIRAGYSGEEVQAIFAAGVDTGTWNIDNLLDGLKEGRIQLASFVYGLTDANAAVVDEAGVSQKVFLGWAKAVSEGGEQGTKALIEVANTLNGIQDEAAREDLGVLIFGTKFEDQGQHIINTILGAKDATADLKSGIAELNAAQEQYNADPLVRMKDALNDVMTSLQPLLLMVADFVAKIAEWVSNNAGLAAVLLAIGTALGVLTGGFAVLMPAIGALVGLWPALIGAISGIGAPILLAVGAIVGLGLAFTKLWQESETFRDTLTNVFNSIKDVVTSVLDVVVTFVQEKVSKIKEFWTSEGQQILKAVENAFNGIKGIIGKVMPAVQLIIEYVWKAIQNVINGALDVIMGAVKVFSGLFTGDFSKMWEGVKQIFSGAIDLIIGLMSLSFVGSIRTLLTNLAKSGLSLLKGMWDDIVQAFTTMGSKASGVVSSMVNSVVGFFKNLLSNTKSVFNTLKTFGATTFEALKTAVINSASKILSGVKTSFTNMLNTVKTTMGNLKTNVSNLWDKVVAIFKPDALLQIGKDIVNGLIKGIGDMFGGVRKKVESLAALIPEWARDILGIASPSKVFKQIGKWISEGWAIGIEEKGNMVQNAVNDIALNAKDIAEHYVNEEKKLRSKANSDIAKIETDKASKIATIEKRMHEDVAKAQRSAASKKKKTTQDDALKIQRIREDAIAKIAKLEETSSTQIEKIKTDSTKKIVGLESEMNKTLLEETKRYIEDKKSLDQLTIIEEAHIWEQSMKLFAEGTKERVKAQQEYKKATEAVNKEITAINTDFQGQINKVNEELIKQEETLTKAYEDAVDKRAQSLYSFKNLFDEFKVEIDTTGDQLLANLGSQVEGFKVWQKEIEKLSEKAIDKGLLAELREMGPNALPQLIALNRMTDTQLTQYSNLYKEKSKLARTQAETEMIGMKTDTDKQISELRIAANKQLDTLQNEWNTKIKSLTKSTATELSTLKQVGIDAGNGLLQGLASTQGALQKKAQEIANSISKTIQSALKIKSPSRIMMGFGENIGEGLIIGMDDMIKKVAQSSARLSNAVVNAQSSLASSAQKSAEVSSINNRTSTSTIDNSKYMQPNITIINQVPNASPSELARKAVQAQRQLAMEWGV